MDVSAVMMAIADDVLALAHLILEDDSISTNVKIGENTLRDSALNHDLAVRLSETGRDDTIIRALFNNYVGYIEWDRPPEYGTKPPIDALKGWAEKNGIPTDAGTLWAISTAIWRDGHEGRPIFATLDKELDGLYMNDWADKLFNAVTQQLDNYFND